MHLTKSDFIKTLRRLPLFVDLSDDELSAISEGMQQVHLEKGRVIFEEGDECSELLIIEEGEVKLFKSAMNGRQQLLGIERRGSALAEVAALDGGRYPSTAQTNSATSLLRISAARFRNICANNPAMALKVFKVFGHKLRHLADLVEELSFSTVRSRLIAYLLRLAEKEGPPQSECVEIELKENNEELAARLGTVRELVSRNLGRLHGDGLIAMKKRAVVIRSLSALREEIEREA